MEIGIIAYVITNIANLSAITIGLILYELI